MFFVMDFSKVYDILSIENQLVIDGCKLANSSYFQFSVQILDEEIISNKLKRINYFHTKLIFSWQSKTYRTMKSLHKEP